MLPYLLLLLGLAALAGLSHAAAGMNPYLVQILVYIGINIILASSLNLISGFTGQFSLGHAGFMAIGAYVSAAISYYLGGFALTPKVAERWRTWRPSDCRNRLHLPPFFREYLSQAG